MVHLLLVAMVAVQSICSDIARGMTWLPAPLEEYAGRVEEWIDIIRGATGPRSNAVWLGLSSYLHSAGVEAGYGFFAPAVSSSAKIVFEFHYDDGGIDYDLPQVRDRASSLRLIGLLQFIGDTEYEPLRRALLKVLAHSAWRNHARATMVRAVYGYIDEPTRRDARHGATESYHVLYVYDFRFRPDSTPSRDR